MINDAIDFKAKYHHFVKTLLVLMGIVILVFFKIYTDQKNDLKFLNDRLDNRDILLIPSSLEVHTGKLNQVSDKDVKNEALFITSLMGNLSRETIDLNFQTIAEKMPVGRRVKFLNESALKINYIKDNDIAEIVKSHNILLKQTGNYSYRAKVELELIVMIDDLKSGTKSEILEFDLKVLSPTKSKRWALSVVTFKRLTPVQYDKLQEIQ